VRETFSVRALPLEVESYDQLRLLAAYEAIMRESRDAIEHPSGSWVGHDFLDIPAPVRSILWAYGPEAVPYQLDLLFDDARGFRYWPPATVHTWDNIVQYATVEQVECLVDLAAQLGVEKTPYAYSGKYAPGFIWAVHELHEHGAPGVRELTGGLVEEFPKEDLCPHSMVIGVMPYGKG
jgi:hypothetical protein